MHRRRLSNFVQAVALILATVPVVGVLALLGAQSSARPRGSAVAAVPSSAVVEPLATSTSVLGLIAGELSCLHDFGLVSDLHVAENELDHAHLQGLRNFVAGCAAVRDGRPPPIYPSFPHPSVPPGATPVSGLELSPHRPAGDGTILQDGQTGIKTFATRNKWYVQTPTGMLWVYAGAVKRTLPDGHHDASQGGVIVVPSDAQSSVYGLYPTPSAVGQVEVVDAQGKTLVLKTANGTTLYFDVNTGQYVSALPAGSATPSVTATPAPSASSTPTPTSRP